MKNLIPFICSFLFSIALIGQSLEESIHWVADLEESGLEATRIGVDQHDNIYTLANYRGCPSCFVRMNGELLVEGGNGFKDIILTKQDRDGKLLWFRQLGNPLEDEFIGALEIDPKGNPILFVHSNETFLAGESTYAEQWNIIKYDSDGSLLWGKTMEGSSHAYSFTELGLGNKQFAIDNEGNIIIGGKITESVDLDAPIDTLIIGPDTLIQYETFFNDLIIDGQSTSIDANNFFLAKLNNDGELLWVKTFEHPERIYFKSLEVSANNDINIVGTYTKTDLDLEGTVLEYQDPHANFFIAQLDQDGELDWAQTYSGHVNSHSIASDNEGNLFVVGVARDSFNFENETIIFPDYGNLLLLKVNQLEENQWARKIETRASPGVVFLDVNEKGDLFFSGKTGAGVSGSVFFKYNTEGVELDAITPNYGINRIGGDFAIDHAGNLIMTGARGSGDLIFGDVLIASGEAGSFGWHQYMVKFVNPNALSPTVENQETLNDNITCFPNPSTNSVQLQFQNDTRLNKISITNSTGMLLKENHYDNEWISTVSFDLKEFGTGIYFFKIDTEESSFVKKVMVEK